MVAASIQIQSQYLRDLSFELVKSPWEKQTDESKIKLSNDISVITKQFEGLNIFEVAIKLNLKLLENSEELFIIDMEYCGIFDLKGINPEHYQKILAIDCAHLLFPFIRQIISTVTQDSGFRALSLNPINFYEIYHKKSLENHDLKTKNIKIFKNNN
ncbi:MAG: protein-export chaperone SecB [Rickettsia sp.]|nr:protein-export chaperone SecB [Rickettsia sp.]